MDLLAHSLFTSLVSVSTISGEGHFTVMGWGGSLGYDLPAGDTKTVMMIVILFIISLVGLAIGTKPILKGPSS